MPGAGKTTIARKLAEKINYRFIDLDQEIERLTQLSINKIFEKYGEEYFRNLETLILKKIFNDEKIVVATGGGIIEKTENLPLIDGFVIYLNAPLDQLKENLKNSTLRPLLKLQTLNELYDKRLEKYLEIADAVVNFDSIEEMIKQILKKLKGAN
jgi:shikimate kinase